MVTVKGWSPVAIMLGRLWYINEIVQARPRGVPDHETLYQLAGEQSSMPYLWILELHFMWLSTLVPRSPTQANDTRAIGLQAFCR